MTVNSKMTALANEIRELSGTTDTKNLDEMRVEVDVANTKIAEQAELIAQITTALEGKAGGATLPTLDNPAVAADILSGKKAIDGDGNVITGTITSRTSSNLTASGATVTVPAGYYSSQATKSVATATQATPRVSIDTNGKITASATQTAGYVSAGTKTGTQQMTTQAAKTITPSTSSQTAVAKNVYTTGAVTVAPIPSNYEDVGTETTEYTSLNTELEEVINSLPNAGGSEGGSIGTCTVTLIHESGLDSCQVFYNSLENDLMVGESVYWYGQEIPDIVALQGSVITIINAMNIGVMDDYGLNNCIISNGGILLDKIADQVNIATCCLVIQLPYENTCTITIS